MKQIGGLRRGQLYQVRAGGNLTYFKGGLGFGIETDLRERQKIIGGLGALRRCRRHDDAVEREAFEAGQAVEIGQLWDADDDRSLRFRMPLRPLFG